MAVLVIKLILPVLFVLCIFSIIVGICGFIQVIFTD